MNEISFGAVGAALIAAVVTIVGLILGKEQKTSEFRQAWIDALRAEIVSYLTQAAAIRDKLSVEYKSHEEKVVALGQHYSELNRASHGIKLRLNANEIGSNTVLTEMAAFETVFAEDNEVRTAKLEALEGQMLIASQRLLKSEWRRVKRGEFAFWFAKYLAIALALFLAGALIYSIVWGGQPSKSAPDATVVKIERVGKGPHNPITIVTP